MAGGSYVCRSGPRGLSNQGLIHWWSTTTRAVYDPVAQGTDSKQALLCWEYPVQVYRRLLAPKCVYESQTVRDRLPGI